MLIYVCFVCVLVLEEPFGRSILKTEGVLQLYQLVCQIFDAQYLRNTLHQDTEKNRTSFMKIISLSNPVLLPVRLISLLFSLLLLLPRAETGVACRAAQLLPWRQVSESGLAFQQTPDGFSDASLLTLHSSQHLHTFFRLLIFPCVPRELLVV